jgi:hypothetical protein
VTDRAPVPDEGELRLGAVTLPVGRPLRAQDGDGEPVAWRTQGPVPDPGPVWSALSALHGQTGLVPVLEPVGWGELEASCWDTAAVADVDRVDVAALLEEQWADYFPGQEERSRLDEMAAPFTSGYPGLAPATSPPGASRCGRPPRKSSMPPSGTSGGIDHGDKTTRREEWATGHPALPDLATRVQQFADEIERLRALLRQHGIDPQDKPA